MGGLPSSLKKLLKSSGYVLLVLPFYMYQEWYVSFVRNAFHVLLNPYIFTFNSDTVPKGTAEHFRQKDISLFGHLAKAPGKHSSGFAPQFDSNFHLIKCRYTRRTTVIDGTLCQEATATQK